jgi:FixJ family two-component response regulator
MMTASDSFVAIIDDDASVRRALSRLLKTCSINVETFSSGQDFLDSLSIGRPQCIILDQHMSEMTGLELQRHLRRQGIDIPTIIITAHNQCHLRDLFKAEGVFDYLLKPLSENELLHSINRAMNSSAEKHNMAVLRAQ